MKRMQTWKNTLRSERKVKENHNKLEGQSPWKCNEIKGASKDNAIQWGSILEEHVMKWKENQGSL